MMRTETASMLPGFVRRTACALTIAVAFGLSTAIMPVAMTPAWAQGQTVVLDNLTFDLSIQKITIKRLEVQNSTLTTDELKSLLNGTAAKPLELLARFDSGRVTIPEVTLQQDFAGTKSSSSYSNVVIDSISKGKAAGWSIGGMVMDSAGVPEVPLSAFKGRISKISGQSIDFLALTRVLTTVQTSPEEPLVELYGPAEAENYTIDTPTFEMSVGKISSTAVKGRPMKTPLISLLKTLRDLPQPTKPGEQPTPEQIKQMEPLFGMIGGVYRDFAFGSFDLRAFKMQSKANQQPYQLTLDRVGMSDLANARIGKMVMDGMYLSAPQGTMRLQQIALTDFAFSGMLQMMDRMPGLIAAEAAGITKPGEFPPDLDPRTLIPSIGGFTIKGFDMDVEDPSRPGQRNKASLGLFEIAAPAWLNAIPTKLSITLDRLVVPVPPELATEQSKALGIEAIDLSSALQLGWTEATQELAIDAASVDAGKLGKFSMKGLIGNVSKDVFMSNDQFVVQAALLSSTLRNVEVSLVNGGVFDLLISQSAKHAGVPADQFKADLITSVAIMLPTMLGNTEDAKAAANAITKFIAEPKNLTVSASAPKGFGAADLMEPEKIGEKIKVSASANQ